jgi:hypothetical protein
VPRPEDRSMTTELHAPVLGEVGAAGIKPRTHGTPGTLGLRHRALGRLERLGPSFVRAACRDSLDIGHGAAAAAPVPRARIAARPAEIVGRAGWPSAARGVA